MGRKINNGFYDDLEGGWYESCNHPIALLRAENEARMPWILQTIKNHMGQRTCRILDVGCGGGFLTNELAKLGHHVTGIDLSEKSLITARAKDVTRSVHYLVADAYEPPFPDQSFDMIFALDFLEHVDKPTQIIEKIGALLKPGGFFCYHTFNRNLLSYIFVIKGVEWFVKNTPKDMHVYNLFIKPQELDDMLLLNQMKTIDIVGVSPVMKSLAFWKMLFTRQVPQNLRFGLHSSLMTGYLGLAQKKL